MPNIHSFLDSGRVRRDKHKVTERDVIPDRAVILDNLCRTHGLPILVPVLGDGDRLAAPIHLHHTDTLDKHILNQSIQLNGQVHMICPVVQIQFGLTAQVHITGGACLRKPQRVHFKHGLDNPRMNRIHRRHDDRHVKVGGIRPGPSLSLFLASLV